MLILKCWLYCQLYNYVYLHLVHQTRWCAKQSTANVPQKFKGVPLSKHYHIIWASRQLVNKWCRSLLCDGAQVGDRRLCSAGMSRWRQRQETERLTFDSSEDSAALYQGRTHWPQSCPQCGDVKNNRITLPQSGSTTRPDCNWISECPTTTC